MAVPHFEQRLWLQYAINNMEGITASSAQRCRKMRIDSVQMAVVEDNKEAALEKAAKQVRSCRGADLVILPEMWPIGFMSFDRYFEEAEEGEGTTLSAMRSLAREIGAHLHTGSFVEKEGGRYYNSSYLLSPSGETLANYRKIHLFGYNSRETQLLTPGERVTVVETELGRMGLATCFDLRFPELFRVMADRGAEMFLVCSAWPYPRLEHWLMFNRVRAIENQCFLVSANAVGPNKGGGFTGHSMIVDPWGSILASCGDEETVISTTVGMDRVHGARKEFPGLAGRVDWLRSVCDRE